VDPPLETPAVAVNEANRLLYLDPNPPVVIHRVLAAATVTNATTPTSVGVGGGVSGIGDVPGSTDFAGMMAGVGLVAADLAMADSVLTSNFNEQGVEGVPGRGRDLAGPVTVFRLEGSGKTTSQTLAPARIKGKSLKATASGIAGWGSVGAAEWFDQNGQVIADGEGRDRTLDLTAVASIRNSVDNPAAGGTNGWFAQNGGELAWPRVYVQKGRKGTYTIGEEAGDASLDLINSLRLTLRDVDSPGWLEVSLLALDRGDVPALPAGHKFVGVWELSSNGLEVGGMDVTIRYDDLKVMALGLHEPALKMWEYREGAWRRVPFTLDLEQNLITGHAGDAAYIGVSTPEPGGLLGVGALGYLLGRRRRR
jgi:MYXO-CTERM domain-containing protein